MRRTVSGIKLNIAYRWFLGYDIDSPIPHFAIGSYAFATRFPSELFEEIFAWILESAVEKGFVKSGTIFIGVTHIKANANRNKKRKMLAKATAHVYDAKLREEINAGREAHGKDPLKDRDDDANDQGLPKDKEVTVSTTDPESGLFHKGEYKVEFAECIPSSLLFFGRFWTASKPKRPEQVHSSGRGRPDR